MNYRKYPKYYEYISEVVDKCAHKWIILDDKGFRQYRIDKFHDIKSELPKGKLIKITPAMCKSYSCAICGRKKVHDLMQRLKRVDLKGYRFFTLTLKNDYSKENTESNLQRISECFNKLNKQLRKKEHFKDLQYFRVVEVGKSGMVHVHGIWNKYIPTKDLGMMWYKITGDSFRVKPERIKSHSDAVNYLYKYLTKNIAGDQERHDAQLFGLDLINTAKLFYENGKRRYCASREFFPKFVKEETHYLPYYFESEEPESVEKVIKSLVKNYGLKLEHFDLTLYDASEEFLFDLFFDSS